MHTYVYKPEHAYMHANAPMHKFTYTYTISHCFVKHSTNTWQLRFQNNNPQTQASWFLPADTSTHPTSPSPSFLGNSRMPKQKKLELVV